MRRTAFAPFGRSKAPVATIIIAAFLITPALVLVSTMRSGMVEASPDTFGYETMGTDGQTSFHNRITGSVFTAPGDGVANAIIAYVVATTEGGPNNTKAAIFLDNGTLIGQTNVVSLYSYTGWKTFTFPVPGPSLTASTEYALEIWGSCDDYPGYDIEIKYDTETALGRYDVETYGANFPNPASFAPEDKKYSIYVSYIPPPTKPALIFPENGFIITDNTPTFIWENGSNSENNRIEVDDDVNFGSPEDNVTVFDNTWTKDENGYAAGTYYWRVWAVNVAGQNMSENTWQFVIKKPAKVETKPATNVGPTSATLNAAVIDFGSYDNADIRFIYKSENQCYFEGDNENWHLLDWEYTPPVIDPATEGDYANKSLVWKFAASNSSTADKNAADENLDGEKDDAEINAALDNENIATVFLFAGSYSIDNMLGVHSYASLIGAGRDNTILVISDNVGLFAIKIYVPPSDPADNVLIENLTLQGAGRLIEGEHSGIQSSYGENIVIRNMLAQDFTAIGIYFEGGTFVNLWIDNNEVRETGNHGIAVVAGTQYRGSESSYIINNTLINCGIGSPSYGEGKGIQGFRLVNSVIANNTIENCGGLIGINTYSGTPVKVENVLIQGNKLRRIITPDWKSLGAITIYNHNIQAENVVILGNDIDALVGIEFGDDNAENCIIDNNNLFNTVEGIVENGLGHIIVNNVQPHLVENNYTKWVVTNVENYSENVENLDHPTMYAFKAIVEYDEIESSGTVLTFTTPGVEQPLLFSPENDSIVQDTTPSFEWTNGAGADYHRLVVGNENFTDNVININIAMPDNSYTAESPIAVSNYWWKVIATYGNEENSSSVWTFAIILFEGSGTIEDPYLIPNVKLLQKMDDYKTSHFALDNNIGAENTINWNNGAGFLPIGENDNHFVGSLDGRGYIVSNLFINRSSTDCVGIFGAIGSGGIVENMGIENENIIGSNYVGSLVGYNEGVVSKCYSTGSVHGDNYVGGLVGTNAGTVRNTYSASGVSGYSDVGGLVGHNDGLVSKSYSVGAVTGYYNTGGLVGYEIGYTGAVWNDVMEWINYASSSDVWFEVGTWTNYENVTQPVWNEVGTWTNDVNVLPWWREWFEVMFWTNDVDTTKKWVEAGTWTNDVDSGPPIKAWYSVATWTNDATTRVLTLYENYTVFPDMDVWFYGINWRAQTFTVITENHSVTAIKIRALREGTPGILTASIRATDESGHPLGSDLTSGTIDADTFTTNPNGAWYEIALTEYDLDNDTKYAIVLRAPSGSDGNEVLWGGDWTRLTYTDGNFESSTNSGSSWTAYTEYDMLFEVWGYATDGTVEGSFYDNQTSGQFDNGKGVGLSTSEMLTISPFIDAGWDIVMIENYDNEIWYIDNARDYPRLGWQWESPEPEWFEAATWTNDVNVVQPGWSNAMTWTNDAYVLAWHEAATWIGYPEASTWYYVMTWTNDINSHTIGWYEVGTWTNYLDVTPPEWREVAEWSNYLEVGLGKPTLISPENASMTYDDTPIFNWENGANADDHWFVLDDDSDFSSPIENLIVQTETYTIPEENPLPYDNYWWKVIAENATDEKESDVWTFELRYQKPPPPEEFAWGAFMIRFLAVIGPFGFIAWKFTKIKDPVTGAKAAMWALVGFVAFVVLWFVADAVEAVLYAM